MNTSPSKKQGQSSTDDNVALFTPKIDNRTDGTLESTYFNVYIQNLLAETTQEGGLPAKEFYELINCYVVEENNKLLIIYFSELKFYNEIALYKVSASDNIYITDNNPLDLPVSKDIIKHTPQAQAKRILYSNWLVNESTKYRTDDSRIIITEIEFKNWFKDVALKT